MPESRPRTEFSAQRSTCACETCINNCRFMPGYLIPSDLDRLIPKGVDPMAWAAEHLQASPGALVGDTVTGRTFRIPTLVPATRRESLACHWLDKDNRCQIHAIAPFGCAFFSHRGSPPEEDRLSSEGLRAINWAIIQIPPSLYLRLWRFLTERNLVSPPPEIKRRAMAKADRTQQRRIDRD